MKQNGQNSRTNLLYSFLVFTAIIGVCVVPIVSAANESGQQGDPAGSFITVTPTISLTTTPTTGTPLKTEYSVSSSFIVFCLIVILGILFILLIWWSNKLDQAGYLGTMYQDTIYDIEWKRRKEAIEQKKNNNEFIKEAESNDIWITEETKPQLPELSSEIAILKMNFSAKRTGETYNPYISYYSPSSAITNVYEPGYFSSYDPEFEKQFEESLPEKLKEIYITYKKRLFEYQTKILKEAQALNRKELKESQEKAKEQAKDAVSVDMGVIRGKGSEFVLEFTTVVVIIFAAAILGVLQVLGTEQIGTLLAAIAGYVLGRATTKTKEGTTTTAPSSTVVDIINAIKGTGGNTPQATGRESPQSTGGIQQPGTAGTGQQSSAATGTPSGPQGKS